MRNYVVNRPEEAAMLRLLERCDTEPEGIVLRLAWQAGLSREEISALTWDQVSFPDERLELTDRSVPLEEELLAVLRHLYEEHGDLSPRVVLSARGRTPLAPESISRLARRALDREGQGVVRLMDLRHDWIIRQLAEKDWPAVARISGVEVPALQARFASWRGTPPEKRGPADRTVDEFKLWRVLQEERSSPAGLALWLAWQMGLQAREIAALTWDQVDLAGERLRLPDRDIPMTNAVRRILEETRRRAPEGEPHVVLTERSRKPLDLPRLTRLTRAALIRGGMEDISLRDLRRREGREEEEARLLAAAGEGPISRGDVMALLGLSKTAAYDRLHRLAEERKLVRIGGKYYLPDRVVPPERHLETIRAYLEQAGFAYRQDLADLLRIRREQCAQVLRRLVEAGELEQHGQKYSLPARAAFRTE